MDTIPTFRCLLPCRPERLGDVWVVPLQSWHHRTFDTEPEVPGLAAAAVLAIHDYAACVWPDFITGRPAAVANAQAKYASVWPDLILVRGPCAVHVNLS